MLGAGAAERKTDFRLLKSYISKKLFFLALPYFFLVADRQMSSMGKTPFGLIFSRLLKFSVICTDVRLAWRVNKPSATQTDRFGGFDFGNHRLGS